VGIHRLDLLVVSHADIDHRGGVPAVREHLEIDDERGALAGQRPCRAGENWRWDGVDFRFIHPDRADWGDNNGSCVLRISAGDHAALLPGDIELPAETHLLALGDGLPADVLVAPHHGSRTSSSAGFVDAVAPRVVIFPAGWQNRFHHPAPEVVDRYRREGAETWITGTEGAVDIRLREDGEPAAASGWRARHARWWNARPPPRSEAVEVRNQADAAPDRDR
jgi:competence protein ComEC